MAPSFGIPGLGWTIPSYESAYACAAGLAFLFGPSFIARHSGAPAGQVRLAMLVLILVAFAGARAFFAATHWQVFADDPVSALYFWRGGRNAPVALAALLLVAPAVLPVLGLPVRRFLDAGVPVALGVLGIARIGCFLHGCCSGVATTWPWSVRFPPHSAPYRLQVWQQQIGRDAPFSLPVHPLQLYFAAVAFAVAIVSLRWLRTAARDGDVVLRATLAVTSSSALLELLRADYPGRLHVGGQPMLLWVNGLTFVAAGAIGWWTSRAPRHRPGGSVGRP